MPDTADSRTPFSIVILAAGESARMGSPKQLLGYAGSTLLENMVQTALDAGLGPVWVVLGSQADRMMEALGDKPVRVICNESWREGMASSVRMAVETIQQVQPETAGLLFLVCDQPLVTPDLLRRILETQLRSGMPLVASAYEGHLGTPALIHREMFGELLALKGDTGARKIFLKFPDRVSVVPFPGGNFDVDTPKDYQRLLDSDL